MLATDRGQSPIALDEISTTIWRSFDGQATIEELALDLNYAIGAPIEECHAQVDWLVWALAIDGFLDWPGNSAQVVPRRLAAALAPDTCLGETIGTTGDDMVQVRPPSGPSFRFGCTIPAVLDRLSGLFPTEKRTDEPLETYFLRASTSACGNQRASYLFDSLGNPIYLSWDLDSSVDALSRTIQGRMSAHEGTWVQCLAIQSGDRVILIHPSARDACILALRGPARSVPALFVPSALMKALSPSELLVPAAQPQTPARPVEVIGIVAPTPQDDIDDFRMILHLARTWDQPHLAAIASLLSSVQRFTVDGEYAMDQLAQNLQNLLAE